MNEIPEDVMAAARKHCDLAGVTPHSDMRVHCEHVAAFAILAERERCAKVAREVGSYLAYGSADWEAACVEIEEAIMKGATT